MATNFKSFFLFLSAFLINVQFTTPVDPAVIEGTYFSEQVTEPALLERQENAALFIQFLIDEIIERDSFQQLIFVDLEFNNDHRNRQEYQYLQLLALNHQGTVQLKIKVDDYLFQFHTQMYSNGKNFPALFQLS